MQSVELGFQCSEVISLHLSTVCTLTTSIVCEIYLCTSQNTEKQI